MSKINRFLKIKNLAQQASVLLIALFASFFSLAEETPQVPIQSVIVGDTDSSLAYPLCGLVRVEGRDMGRGCANVEKMYIKIRLENDSTEQRENIYEFIKSTLLECAVNSKHVPIEYINMKDSEPGRFYRWELGNEFLPKFDAIIFDSKISVSNRPNKKVGLTVSTAVIGNQTYFMNSDSVDAVSKEKMEDVIKKKIREHLFKFVTPSIFPNTCNKNRL